MARFLADRTATQYGRLLASSCRPSVRPSVCLSVTLCSVAFRVGVQGEKLYQRVPSSHVPISPFRHFCCRMYRLARKRTAKNEGYLLGFLLAGASNESGVDDESTTAIFGDLSGYFFGIFRDKAGSIIW